MRGLIIACFVFICVSCVAGMAFKGNVSFEVNNNDWKYRETDLARLGLLDAVFFKSVSVGGTPHNVHGDVMWGAAYCTLECIPTGWIAFYSANISLGITDSFIDHDISASAGYIATGFVGLIEKDASGKIVAVLDLAQRVLAASPNWDITDSNGSGSLKWVTFTGTQFGQPYTIKITFVVSDTIGVIDYAGATVSPKSLESIIEINNWPYKNAANTLSLIVATATGSGNVEGTSLTSGTGANKVYTTFSNQAIINSSPQAVHVSGFVDATAQNVFADGVTNQISAKYNAEASVKLTNVTFPAGAASIVYDPSIGSGDPAVPPPPSAASTVVAGWLCMFAVVVALL